MYYSLSKMPRVSEAYEITSLIHLQQLVTFCEMLKQALTDLSLEMYYKNQIHTHQKFCEKKSE